MNEIFKNCELFVNILHMSRTPQVQQWDREAFQRAFRWAAYFEQVYKKGRVKPGFADKLDIHLEKALCKNDSCLGVSKLSFSDLENVTDILLNNLLQNAHLSVDFYLQLVEQFQKRTETGEEGFVSEVKSLAKLKATLQVLQLVQRRFYCAENLAYNPIGDKVEKQTVSPTQTHIPRYVIKANAILLRRCLSNSLGGDTVTILESMRTQLYTKLSGVLNQAAGEEVLFTALSSVNSDEGEMRVTSFILRFIEEVVCENWSINWLDFLQLPIRDLLCNTARDIPQFRSMYARVLAACADSIQLEICKQEELFLVNCGETEAREHICARSFAYLQRHFQAVSSACPEVTELLREVGEERCSQEEEGVWAALQSFLQPPPQYPPSSPTVS